MRTGVGAVFTQESRIRLHASTSTPFTACRGRGGQLSDEEMRRSGRLASSSGALSTAVTS